LLNLLLFFDFAYREWKDGFIVYNIHCTFPMNMINVEFYYTYCVQRENKTIWEHFAYDGRLTEKGIRRRVIIPNVLQQGKLYKSKSI
jgi:hypothetical protein